ncbi:hypothetical protein GSI_03992 [Ganoderma sinense ZZ0214-1]|uniref:Uncharacterized protein n=1 Tax=Ganoderma sinense ZZ0214-1 TaxID=1077348 RepID=A0A2G8SHY5_9APHY|nr:hypothetical protein GSI_03992 [Ganoderma sinense ZZ0214-1]
MRYTSWDQNRVSPPQLHDHRARTPPPTKVQPCAPPPDDEELVRRRMEVVFGVHGVVPHRPAHPNRINVTFDRRSRQVLVREDVVVDDERLVLDRRVGDEAMRGNPVARHPQRAEGREGEECLRRRVHGHRGEAFLFVCLVFLSTPTCGSGHRRVCRRL